MRTITDPYVALSFITDTFTEADTRTSRDEYRTWLDRTLLAAILNKEITVAFLVQKGDETALISTAGGNPSRENNLGVAMMLREVANSIAPPDIVD